MTELKITPLEALSIARSAADERRSCSESATLIRAEAKAVYESELKRARALQRSGTRHLVAEIERVRESSDLPLRSVLESIGLAYQSYSELRRNVASWDVE